MIRGMFLLCGLVGLVVALGIAAAAHGSRGAQSDIKRLDRLAAASWRDAILETDTLPEARQTAAELRLVIAVGQLALADRIDAIVGHADKPVLDWYATHSAQPAWGALRTLGKEPDRFQEELAKSSIDWSPLTRDTVSFVATDELIAAGRFDGAIATSGFAATEPARESRVTGTRSRFITAPQSRQELGRYLNALEAIKGPRRSQALDALNDLLSQPWARGQDDIGGDVRRSAAQTAASTLASASIANQDYSALLTMSALLGDTQLFERAREGLARSSGAAHSSLHKTLSRLALLEGSEPTAFVAAQLDRYIEEQRTTPWRTSDAKIMNLACGVLIRRVGPNEARLAELALHDVNPQAIQHLASTERAFGLPPSSGTVYFERTANVLDSTMMLVQASRIAAATRGQVEARNLLTPIDVASLARASRLANNDEIPLRLLGRQFLRIGLYDEAASAYGAMPVGAIERFVELARGLVEARAR